jgi:predicted ferric reductase
VTTTALRTRPDAVRIGAVPALTVIGAGVIAVLALWWQDTPEVSGLGDWLTNAGRITGLLAGYAVIVLLALMARVPALERGVGTDRLTRWHAMGGRYTISLAVAHTLLIIWGYAVSAHTNVIAETSTLELSYPDVLMATVAVLLLVMVGLVSARAARRRLSYETWHFLHLYTYLAIALAFSHAFATGADFTDVRARWLWAGAYVVVAGLLVWFRLLAPLHGVLRYRMQVVDVRAESESVVSLYIGGRHLDELRAESGQFFRWRFLTRDLWWAANPYSLSAPPGPDLLRITVKITGRHSAALRALRPGTRVLAEGPYGSFTAARRRRGRVLLIGAGAGITPLRTLFETVPAGAGEIALIYRASTAGDLVLRAELDEIAIRRGAVVHYLVGSRADDATALSAAALGRLVPGLAEHDVFVCGPDAMSAAVRAELRRAGVPNRHIHHESFTF